ncbi:MAG TPA: hypothetical protein VHB48_02465 [Chitinophagaceae bacterium]|nr:hypothetical protein [Chitinophagaceae bacterium]
MEPEVKEFLTRISFSIGIVVLWFTINSTAGIMFDFAFIHDHVTAGNIIFYIWFAISIFLMVKLLIRLWKNKPQ